MSRPGVQKGPKQPLPDREKSKAFALRLHPSIPEEAMTIEFIQHNLGRGMTMRELFVAMVVEREGRGEEDFVVSKFDAKAIRGYLENIFERLKHGLAPQVAQPSSMPARDMSEEELDDYDRFLDMGLSADDIED